MDKILESALAAQNSGDLEGAKLLFLKFLKTSPFDVAALYSLASIELQQGRLDRALEFISRAIDIRKDFAPSFFARSVIFSGLSKVDEALRDAEIAVALDPGLNGLKEHLSRLKDLRRLDQTDHSGVYTHLAELNAQAIALQNSGEAQRARSLFEKVLTVDPENFVALYSMGVLVGKDPFNEDPLDYLRRAVNSSPASALAHFAYGTTLQQYGFLEDAIGHFDQAIALDPNYIEPYTNKSSALHNLNRQRDAVLTLEQALLKQPNDVKLLGNKGYLLTEFKENKAAAACFDKVLELDKDYEYGEGLRAYAKLHVCDWTNFEANLGSIKRGVVEGRRVINPLAFMAFSSDSEEQLLCAKTFASHRFPLAHQPLWRGDRYVHRALRVGFISADFREHPVGYLFIELLEQLRALGIDTIGISCGIEDGSDLFKRYRSTFTHCLDARRLTSLEVAKWMRAMEVDIAVDLSGYTAGTRLDILSHRPCPKQISYLGFPGSLGSPYIDALIADKIVIPETELSNYSEKVYYLDACYLPRDLTVKPSTTHMTRIQQGLPKVGTVYCCFCHVYKVNPAVFTLWLEILKLDKDSILWLNLSHKDAKHNLLEEFRKNGISPERIHFAERLPSISDHLSRYQLANVFLDTFPYNGHTTMSDALFAGVPAVTLPGRSFASRVGLSLLTDIDRTNWSAESVDQFCELAISTAHDKKARKDLEAIKEERSWPRSSAEFAENFFKLLISISKSS